MIRVLLRADGSLLGAVEFDEVASSLEDTNPEGMEYLGTRGFSGSLAGPSVSVWRELPE